MEHIRNQKCILVLSNIESVKNKNPNPVWQKNEPVFYLVLEMIVQKVVETLLNIPLVYPYMTGSRITYYVPTLISKKTIGSPQHQQPPPQQQQQLPQTNSAA
ncbi:unnamed protein product [Lupinus luteus]|uniref:Uncharacterized protein n=1 Tax=Lupinus luteus TaxID=3873 RepID=A0AAV1WNJ1_LUPLU